MPTGSHFTFQIWKPTPGALDWQIVDHVRYQADSKGISHNALYQSFKKKHFYNQAIYSYIRTLIILQII
jgi:hypothetical protein